MDYLEVLSKYMSSDLSRLTFAEVSPGSVSVRTATGEGQESRETVWPPHSEALWAELCQSVEGVAGLSTENIRRWQFRLLAPGCIKVKVIHEGPRGHYTFVPVTVEVTANVLSG